MKFGPLLPKLS